MPLTCRKCKKTTIYAKIKFRNAHWLEYVIACWCGNEWHVPYPTWDQLYQEQDALRKASQRELLAEIAARPYSWGRST